VATPNYSNLFTAEVHANHLNCAVAWAMMGIRYNWPLIGRDFVHAARSTFVAAALLGGYTHIFFLDDDALITPDLLPKYLLHDRDVVITPFWLRRHPHTCGVKVSTTGDFEDIHSYRTLTDQDLHRGLLEVDGGGTHAMLINTDVFRRRGATATEQMTFEEEDASGIWPHFFMPREGTEDMAWCQRARRKGIRLWCDTDAEAGHMGFPRVITGAVAAELAQQDPLALGLHDITAGPGTHGVSSMRHPAVDVTMPMSLS
jgi:hypothetical protein